MAQKVSIPKETLLEGNKNNTVADTALTFWTTIILVLQYVTIVYTCIYTWRHCHLLMNQWVPSHDIFRMPQLESKHSPAAHSRGPQRSAGQSSKRSAVYLVCWNNLLPKQKHTTTRDKWRKIRGTLACPKQANPWKSSTLEQAHPDNLHQHWGLVSRLLVPVLASLDQGHLSRYKLATATRQSPQKRTFCTLCSSALYRSTNALIHSNGPAGVMHLYSSL